MKKDFSQMNRKECLENVPPRVTVKGGVVTFHDSDSHGIGQSRPLFPSWEVQDPRHFAAILGTVVKAMRHGKMSQDEINQYVDEATKADFAWLVEVSRRFVYLPQGVSK